MIQADPTAHVMKALKKLMATSCVGHGLTGNPPAQQPDMEKPMRDFVKSLSAGERFSAILIAAAFFSVIIPAAIAYSHAQEPAASNISWAHLP